MRCNDNTTGDKIAHSIVKAEFPFDWSFGFNRGGKH